MIRSSEYKYCVFGFDYFNPVQESCYEYFEQDCNLVVSSEMASGKTAIAEAIIGYELTKPIGRACYVSPLKALTNEKLNQWVRHETFSRHGVLEVSGDNFATQAEIDNNRLIVTTIEALDVRCRRKEQWLRSLSLLVFDEAHLFNHIRRGADAEALLMELTRFNPSCRIVCLSGTLKNVKQIAQWLKILNGKKTFFVNSTWRPTKLKKSVEIVSGLNEQMDKVLNLANEFVYDKILVFVHSKVVGENLTKYLKKNNVIVDFFHSDLDVRRKEKIAKAFKDEFSGLNLIISTSSLGAGVDL